LTLIDLVLGHASSAGIASDKRETADAVAKAQGAKQAVQAAMVESRQKFSFKSMILHNLASRPK